MSNLSEELRKIYLEELGVDVDKAPPVANEAQVWQEAQTLFIEQLHPMFVANWGDQWLKASGIENNFKSSACNLWFVTLYGLSTAQVARALVNFSKDTGGGFPPTPFRFREYCKGVKEQELNAKAEQVTYRLLN